MALQSVYEEGTPITITTQDKDDGQIFELCGVEVLLRTNNLKRDTASKFGDHYTYNTITFNEKGDEITTYNYLQSMIASLIERELEEDGEESTYIYKKFIYKFKYLIETNKIKSPCDEELHLIQNYLETIEHNKIINIDILFKKTIEIHLH